MEGKLSIEQLRMSLPEFSKQSNSSIIVGPGIGIDAAAIDINKAQAKARQYYEVKDNIEWYL